ncbi:hypothetical protein TRVA0_055S00782 [Trichomonascus vanleenenianus]|uniref:uncharacterized protein n=1 Tax=Trichomonascus vanleenenianus TaxID=2268995 RepID=UPI003EC9F716
MGSCYDESELLRRWEKVFQDKSDWLASEGKELFMSDEEEWYTMLDSYLKLDDEFGGDYLDYLDTETLDVPLDRAELVNPGFSERFDNTKKWDSSKLIEENELNSSTFERFTKKWPKENEALNSNSLIKTEDDESPGYYIPRNTGYVSDEDEKRRQREEVRRCREELFDGGNMKSCSLLTATDGVSPRWNAFAASLDKCLPLRVSKPTKSVTKSAHERKPSEELKEPKEGASVNAKKHTQKKPILTRKKLPDLNKPVPNYMKSTKACENKRRFRQEEENDIFSSLWKEIIS